MKRPNEWDYDNDMFFVQKSVCYVKDLERYSNECEKALDKAIEHIMYLEKQLNYSKAYNRDGLLSNKKFDLTKEEVKEWLFRDEKTK